MRTTRSCLVPSAAALAVALLALVPSSAGAQSAPAPDPDLGPAVVNSWALTPSGDTPGEPGTRPNLSYELSPGDEVKDSVTLLNYSNVQLTFRIYATDAFNNVDGNFDLLTGDKTPVDAGSWVSLPQANITVPAQSTATLPVTIAVPPDAGPGDHAAAILASSQSEGSGPDGKLINLDRRTGSRLYVKVAGPVYPALDVERIKGTYHPALNPLGGALDIAYTVRNRGNVRLAARQRLALRGPFGIGLDRATPVDVPELLPGNEVTLQARFEGVPAAVLLGTSITLTPLAGAGATSPDAAAERTRTGRTLAIPWSMLVLLLSAALISYARKAYRAQPGPRATGPGARGRPAAPGREPRLRRCGHDRSSHLGPLPVGGHR